MRLFWAVPPSSNIETVVKSLDCFPHSHEISMGFLGEIDCNAILAKDIDAVLYIGAVGGVHSFTTVDLLRLREKFKTYLICYGDPGWEPLLDEYANLDVFTRTAVITGNEDYRRKESDFITLCPIDTRGYEKKEKDIGMGFVGGLPPARVKLLEEVKDIVTVFSRNDNYNTHDAYKDWLCRCICYLNMNFFDSTWYVQSVHMKVVEAAYAGCILLETYGARTNKWFTPGVDYLEYQSAEDIRRIASFILFNESIDYAENLSRKVKANFSPEKFWGEFLK